MDLREALELSGRLGHREIGRIVSLMPRRYTIQDLAELQIQELPVEFSKPTIEALRWSLAAYDLTFKGDEPLATRPMTPDKPRVVCAACGRESGRGYAVVERPSTVDDLEVKLGGSVVLSRRVLCKDCNATAKVLIESLERLLTPGQIS